MFTGYILVASHMNLNMESKKLYWSDNTDSPPQYYFQQHVFTGGDQTQNWFPSSPKGEIVGIMDNLLALI